MNGWGIWIAVLLAHADTVARGAAFGAGLAMLAFVVRRREPTASSVRAHVEQDLAHAALRTALVVPLVGLALSMLDRAVTEHAGFLRLSLLARLPSVLQLVLGVVVVDLLEYGVHRLFHGVPWLWRLHAVHHSQTWVNPLTTVRTHPLEIAIKRGLLWAPWVVLGSPSQPWPLWIALDGAWGFFVHSGIDIDLGPLGWIVVSPRFHRLHHSLALEHRDANYGERLAIWDRLFGTARTGAMPVSTGVDDASFPVEREPGLVATARTLVAQLWYPFARRRRVAPPDAGDRRSGAGDL